MNENFPSCPDVEIEIIGKLLTFEEAAIATFPLVTDVMFYIEQHRKIFKVMRQLWDEQKPIDPLSVANRMFPVQNEERQELLMFLLKAQDHISLLIAVKEHCMILIQYYIAREGILLSSDFSQRLAKGDDVFDCYDNFMIDLLKAYSHTNIQQSTKVTDVINESIEQITRIRNKEISMLGIPTLLTSIDTAINGLQSPDLVIIAARPSMGKAQPLTSLILMSDGSWKRMGDIEVGDEIASEKREYSVVTGVFPQGNQQTYRVVFADGRECRCTGSHLWQTYSTKYIGNATRVTTLDEVREKLKSSRYQKRISIPQTTGVFGIQKKFIIHPYLMGVLLGDGCLTKGALWNKPDDEIVDKVTKVLPKGCYVKSMGDNRRILGEKNPSPVFKELKRYGLFKLSIDKFIPDDYLTCCKTPRQRTEASSRSGSTTADPTFSVLNVPVQ